MHGPIYSFFPDGFILPTEYTKFVAHYAQQGMQTLNRDSLDAGLVVPSGLGSKVDTAGLLG